MIDQEKFRSTVERCWNQWNDYDIKEGTSATFCNRFVTDVTTQLTGYEGFIGLRANQMYNAMMFETENWSEVKFDSSMNTDLEFYRKTIEGNLVIASQQGDPSGHVCIVLPSEFVISGKWGKYVPLCANIGKSNFLSKAISWAFRLEPKYFIYKGANNVQ